MSSPGRTGSVRTLRKALFTSSPSEPAFNTSPSPFSFKFHSLSLVSSFTILSKLVVSFHSPYLLSHSFSLACIPFSFSSQSKPQLLPPAVSDRLREQQREQSRIEEIKATKSLEQYRRLPREVSGSNCVPCQRKGTGST